MVPALLNTTLYNGEHRPQDMCGTMVDRVSFVLGYPIIRQERRKTGTDLRHLFLCVFVCFWWFVRCWEPNVSFDCAFLSFSCLLFCFRSRFPFLHSYLCHLSFFSSFVLTVIIIIAVLFLRLSSPSPALPSYLIVILLLLFCFYLLPFSPLLQATLSPTPPHTRTQRKLETSGITGTSLAPSSRFSATDRRLKSTASLTRGLWTRKRRMIVPFELLLMS